MKLIDINIDCFSLILNNIDIEHKLILHKSNKKIYNLGICKINKNYKNLFIYWCRINKFYYNIGFLQYWDKIDEYKQKYGNVFIWKRNCNFRENNIFEFPSIENLKYIVDFEGNWGLLSLNDSNQNNLILQTTYKISYDKKTWKDFPVHPLILYKSR